MPTSAVLTTHHHPLSFDIVAGADDGIEEIVTGGMCLRCLQTRTGIKFVVTAEKGTSDMDLVLREIYVLVRQQQVMMITDMLSMEHFRKFQRSALTLSIISLVL